MQTEDAADARCFEDAIGDAGLRAAFSFFGGLEDESDRATERMLPLGEELRDAKRDGDVDVVAAGVHDAGDLRCEGEAGGLRHGEGVDIGAPEEGWAAALAFDEGGDACLGDGADVGGADDGELVPDDFLGAVFLPGELGMAMQVTPKRDHLIGDRADFGPNGQPAHDGSLTLPRWAQARRPMRPRCVSEKEPSFRP